MPESYDPDTSHAVRVLRVFRKLAINRRKYYQSDLASEFSCSPQTIIRVMADIERVIGASLQTGLDHRRRWYRIEDGGGMVLSAPAAVVANGVGASLGAAFSFGFGGKKGRLRARLEENIPEYALKDRGVEAALENAASHGHALSIRYQGADGQLFAPTRLLSLNGAQYAAGAFLDASLAPKSLALLELDAINSADNARKAPKIDFEALSPILPWLDDDPVSASLLAQAR